MNQPLIDQLGRTVNQHVVGSPILQDCFYLKEFLYCSLVQLFFCYLDFYSQFEIPSSDVRTYPPAKNLYEFRRFLVNIFEPR